MCIPVRHGESFCIYILYIRIYDAALTSPPPPPQWVWVYRSYVPRPPCGWVGGLVVVVVVVVVVAVVVVAVVVAAVVLPVVVVVEVVVVEEVVVSS